MSICNPQQPFLNLLNNLLSEKDLTSELNVHTGTQAAGSNTVKDCFDYHV